MFTKSLQFQIQIVDENYRAANDTTTIHGTARKIRFFLFFVDNFRKICYTDSKRTEIVCEKERLTK